MGRRSRLPNVSEDNRIGALFDEFHHGQVAVCGLTEEEVRSGCNARLHLAYADAERIAAQNARIERAFVEGLGQLEAQIPATTYFAMMAVHGRDCWQDPDFLRSYQSHNPGSKPVSRSRKTTVRAPGLIIT
jgi:hypothetical protein